MDLLQRANGDVGCTTVQLLPLGDLCTLCADEIIGARIHERLTEATNEY
jgi:hypothetical protein